MEIKYGVLTASDIPGMLYILNEYCRERGYRRMTAPFLEERVFNHSGFSSNLTSAARYGEELAGFAVYCATDRGKGFISLAISLIKTRSFPCT